MFWAWFQANDAALFDFEKDQEKTFDRLAAELHKVNPDLTFEFGPKEHGTREFVLSADGIRAAFPNVEALYAAAPKMNHWNIIKFRPRREPMDIEYNGTSVKAATTRALVRRAGTKIGVILYFEGYKPADRELYTAIAFLILDGALGEYDVETKIGSIDVRSRAEADPHAAELAELPAAFDALYLNR
jgi:hypothetical protein